MLRSVFLKIIRIYQLLFSPDQSFWGFPRKQVCRFYPTCSQYMFDSVKKHGLAVGFLMGAKRVFRCHPWHKGGYDPVV